MSCRYHKRLKDIRKDTVTYTFTNIILEVTRNHYTKTETIARKVLHEFMTEKSFRWLVSTGRKWYKKHYKTVPL